MNDKEQRIAQKLLDAIDVAVGADVPYAINSYLEFLNAVNTRLCIEAQYIENQKNA